MSHSLARTARAACCIAFAAVALGALPGCPLISSDSHRSYSGNYVPPDALSKIDRGDTPSYVEAILGEPTSRTELEEGRSICRWDYTVHRRGSGEVLLLYDGDSSTTKRRSVYVQFENGEVEKTWQD